MFVNRLILTGAVVFVGLAAALPGAASAAGPHGHPAAAVELTLDNGQKWQTDEVLRTAMGQIRDAVDASLPPIHEGRYSAAELSTLGDWVQGQVDYVVANCKLPEDADLQLHLVLTQVLDGVGIMKGEGGQEQGAATIVQALNAYGKHFDHPDWRPLAHE